MPTKDINFVSLCTLNTENLVVLRCYSQKLSQYYIGAKSVPTTVTTTGCKTKGYS